MSRTLALALCILGVAAIASLLIATQRPAGAAFPGVNGKIAFVRQAEGSGHEILVMAPDGSGQTVITNNPATDWQPAWSPDGSRIAFQSYRDGDAELYTMNSAGNGVVRLTFETGTDEGPAWSPDGTRIVYKSLATPLFGFSDPGLYLVNADGSGGRSKIPGTTGDDEQPAWSPDGTRIAFVSRYLGAYSIFVMNADGSGRTNLTAASALAPNWSPDGTKIAFSDGRTGNFDVYVMNADGSNQTQLTNHAASDAEPAWSPDGTKLVFRSHREDPLTPYCPCNYEIYVMNADGSNVTRLTTDPATDDQPDWQPRQFSPPSLGGVAEYPPANRRGSTPVALTVAALAAGALAFGGATYARRQG